MFGRRDIQTYVKEWLEGHPTLLELAGAFEAKDDLPLPFKQELLGDVLFRMLQRWDEKRDRSNQPSKDETKQELYRLVDELIEKTFKDEPQSDNGDCERLAIELSIVTWDDEGNALASIRVKRTSERVQ